MANVKIPDLPLNDALTDDDLLVVEQSNGTKKVPLGSVIPDGGTADQLLAKDTNADYSFKWINPPQSLPSGGQTGDVLYKVSNADNDAGWESIGDMAFYDADDIASGVDTVKVGVDMDLLWTNSSPSSSFAEQTVALDLSGYKMVLITLLSFTDSSTKCYDNKIVKIGDDTRRFTIIGLDINFREITATTAGVSFGGGYVVSSYGTTSQSDNKRAMPIFIYGIR